ncbi:MAG: CvpA family protein [Flavobacteriaceae bacterium]
MGIIDIVLAILLLWGLIRGFKKGLFVELASLIALIAGIYGAIHFSNYAVAFLQNKTEWNENTVNIAAFAITFIVIVFAISLAGKALTKLADFAALGILNKLLGAAFGVLKTGLILSAVLLVFDGFNKTIPFASEEQLNGSVLYQPVKSLVPTIFPKLLNQPSDNYEV